MAKANKADVEAAHKTLVRYLKDGATIYSIHRHTARSGMQREISFFTIDSDGRVNWLDYALSVTLGYRLKYGGGYDALVIRGCGFDAAYSVIHDLQQGLGIKLKHERL